MKLREAAISSAEPRVLPPASRPSSAFAWKTDIITTVFFVGAHGGQKQSAWDAHWAETFGGTDTPDAAKRTSDFRPAAFIPRLNPFYCALPYNDLVRGTTKPDARRVIPWFKTFFESEGQSVCRDRWVAIRSARTGRIAFAQWSDCGPHGGGQVEYVFGDEKPKRDGNGGAGLDVSPAVRDFLQINSTDVTDWRFVEVRDVPPGPWRTYGDNNQFVLQARDQPTSPAGRAASPQPELPTINVRLR